LHGILNTFKEAMQLQKCVEVVQTFDT